MKLDTTTLGPIRIDTPAETRRAKLVREAIERLHMDEAISLDEHRALGRLLTVATDATLAQLGRMLR